MKPKFTPGENIALKVPDHEYGQTVAFYRNILNLEEVDLPSADGIESVTFKFGDKTLWIDRSHDLSQAEIWLEVVTEDIEAAAVYFEASGVVRRDEIEPLPEGFKGFWIANPANIIHLISE